MRTLRTHLKFKETQRKKEKPNYAHLLKPKQIMSKANGNIRKSTIQPIITHAFYTNRNSIFTIITFQSIDTIDTTICLINIILLTNSFFFYLLFCMSMKHSLNYYHSANERHNFLLYTCVISSNAIKLKMWRINFMCRIILFYMIGLTPDKIAKKCKHSVLFVFYIIWMRSSVRAKKKR